MLTLALAEKIVDEVKKVLKEEIIITQTNGTIIAGTDTSRIGRFHEGAFLTSSQGQKRVLTKEDEQRLKGVKAGINLPIYFQQDVIGVIGMTGDPEHVSPFGEILRKMTELLIKENEFSQETESHDRQLEAFVFDWLHMPQATKDFHEKAELLQLDVTKDRMIILVDCRGEKLMKRDQFKAVQSMLHLRKHDVIVRWGRSRLLLILETDGEKRHSLECRLVEMHTLLSRYLQADILMGAGQATSCAKIKTSFFQAERALKQADHVTPILFDEDLMLELLIEDLSDEAKHSFLERTISHLLPHQELMKTICMFIKQNHSLKQTAEVMHIHINTLHYRLKRVEELTGLDPKQMQDAVLFFLAFLILDEDTKKITEQHEFLENRP
ncbi:CdaR family transcriptional regulator [Bacillus sp. NPDC077027]|uniref:CdaR family transcriptional regulator n=1 Tax=Bacillus sp. NPDC077027 TaxID=3390548 RepID=UPI003CFBD5FD